MGHWKDFFKNSLTLGFYNVLIQGINFATFSVIAKNQLIDSADYGLVALISVFSGFLFIFSDVGLSYAVIREDFSEELLRKLHFLAIAIGSGLMGIFILLAKPIAWYYDNSTLISANCMCVFIILNPN